MKDFEAKAIDLQSMSEVRGGSVEFTIKDVKLHYTNKQLTVQSMDVKVEVTADVEIEF